MAWSVEGGPVSTADMSAVSRMTGEKACVTSRLLTCSMMYRNRLASTEAVNRSQS